MAIDITPIHEVIQSTVDYQVWDGNFTLLPPSYPEGIVIITCLGYSRLSSEVIERQETQDGQYIETRSWYTLFRYQLDMMRAVDLYHQTSTQVPFETECSAVVSALDFHAPRLANDYGLGISPLEVNYTLELESEIPLHRMTADFTIRALDISRIETNPDPVACVDLHLLKIKKGAPKASQESETPVP